MLNICFTADHELFFGENFASEEEVFIYPTYSLIDVLERYNIPVCLMTDVCSIWRYRALNINNNYTKMMEEQLRYALKRGHDVQLHIHPHWLNSEYTEGHWEFNYTNYRLHSYGFNEDSGLNGRKIIAEGRRYLEDLLTPIDPSYKCIAFRAGGWCLQPEKEFLNALAAEGILIDTTVYYGGFCRDKNSFFDFRRVPKKPNWWIDPQKGLAQEAHKEQGYLLEVAIGSYGFLPLQGLKKLKYKPHRIRSKGETHGTLGISMDLLEKKSFLQRMVNLVKHLIFQPIMFSFDAACLEVMMDLLNYYLKRFDCTNQEIYICIIGHPKTLNKAYLKEIEKFCVKVTDGYRDRVRFIRLRDIPI